MKCLWWSDNIWESLASYKFSLFSYILGEVPYDVSLFKSLSGLDPILQEMLMKNMKKDLVKFALYEEAETKQRYIRPWVQSSPLTDRLGRNSRLLTTVVNSVQSLLGPHYQASTGSQLEPITEENFSNELVK